MRRVSDKITNPKPPFAKKEAVRWNGRPTAPQPGCHQLMLGAPHKHSQQAPAARSGRGGQTPGRGPRERHGHMQGRPHLRDAQHGVVLVERFIVTPKAA